MSLCRELDELSIGDLDGESQFVLDISWSAKTESNALRMERTEQRRSIIERAAIAVAALLISHLIHDSPMEVLKQADRADYWLPRRHEAVEISGTEHAGEIARRRCEKVRQVLENPYGMGGHVVICCFDESHRAVQWSYHSQPE